MEEGKGEGRDGGRATQGNLCKRVRGNIQTLYPLCLCPPIFLL